MAVAPFPARWLRVLVLCALATLPSAGAAQTLEEPVTVVNGSLAPARLVWGRDGSVMQLGSAGGSPLVTRRFPNGLSGSTTPVMVPESNDLGPTLTALPHGGYVAAWVGAVGSADFGFEYRVYSQRLSPAGAPIGGPLPTPLAALVGFPGVAPAGDGHVVAYQDGADAIVGQRYDATGTPVGAQFTIEADAGISNTSVVAMPNGFLVVWGRDGDTRARLYAADATPQGGSFLVAESFRFTGLAVNPAGTLAAIVGVGLEFRPNPDEIRLRFFAPDGSFVGADQLIAPRVQNAEPDVASDPSGNFLVAFGPGIQARAYDANGGAFGPSVTLTTLGSAAGNVKATARRDGGFFAMRSSGNNKTYIARITLCAPGSAICGDGTLVPTCEICDAGAGNSDTTPDACRTDCHRHTCGDGTVDGDEECDDGNAFDCDGCTELCDLEIGTTCGDGLAAPPKCGEQCDDANGIGGDGCSPACELERIFGGGSPTTDCWAAWRIDNPSNDPRFDKRGAVNPKQRCRDNDPACDFDGGVAGSCTFHVAVCVNNSEPAACVPNRLQSWTVVTPSAKQAVARPALAAVRAALEAAVVPTVVGAGDPDTCGPDADVAVPLRGQPGAYKAGKLKLKTRGQIYSGGIDTDGIMLRCDP